ncbi:putative sulfotransferase 1C2A [Apostichopus japonicus]|uniref:Putative sulfotransferase 1C2A n=1 Tax=Stichopus japonicus TaxID=307972 RepID=A0A2G8LD83_STIJA|nr:putative sulfotransferase 1C2A [Apostichopus japonicus]
MNKVLPNYAGWDEFLDQFCKGLLPHGDWFEHNIYWWERRNEPNVLFIKYEDMKKDLRASVLQVSQFLAKSLTDEQLDNICENVTFNNMRKNPNVNPDSEGGLGTNWKKSNANHLTFLRKGIVGDWKNWFTVTQSEKFDELSRQKLAGTGLSFTFE